tara:strand:+ start:133 stop:429 length:297 start_codon:yes stop_codon:yes gene_type:complete
MNFDYNIIKITSNQNTKLFAFDITRMKDPRIRVGILKANYKDYLKGDNSKFSPVFEIFATNNYSFCNVYKGRNIKYDEIKKIKDELNFWYINKQSTRC